MLARGTETQVAADLPREFSARLAGLSEEASTALLVAATSGSDDLGPIAAACRRLGLTTAALLPAQTAGVIRLGPEHLEFTHPLMRSYVYETAASADRRVAERAVAEAALGV